MLHETIGRDLGRLVKLIGEVDDAADLILDKIRELDRRGFHYDAENFRAALEVWHAFGERGLDI
jgi:hypothetical protein